MSLISKKTRSKPSEKRENRKLPLPILKLKNSRKKKLISRWSLKSRWIRFPNTRATRNEKSVKREKRRDIPTEENLKESFVINFYSSLFH